MLSPLSCYPQRVGAEFGIREIAWYSGSALFYLFISCHHSRFNRPRGAEPISTELFHGLRKIDVAPHGCLQQNRKRAGYSDMASFGLLSASPLVDEKKVSMNLKSEANRLSLSNSQFQRKTGI